MACLALSCHLPLRADTAIIWGTLNGSDGLFTSDGQVLDDSFAFELGSFAPLFTPTVHNLSDWQSNWRVFDRVSAPALSGWDSGAQNVYADPTFTSAGTSNSPDADPFQLFPEGTQAYIWIYNGKALENSPEWALVTDLNIVDDQFNLWQFSDPTDDGIGALAWNLRDADSVTVGGLHGVQGAGSFSSTPINFTIQTAVVPEPGSLMLLLVGGAWLARRYRRRGASCVGQASLGQVLPLLPLLGLMLLTSCDQPESTAKPDATSATEAVRPLSADELFPQLGALAVVSSDGRQNAQQLRKLAIAQAAKFDVLAREFEARFPNDSRMSEVAYLRAQLSELPREEGGQGESPRAVADKLAQLMANPQTSTATRSRASLRRVELLANEVEAGRYPLQQWQTLAQEHLREFPENPSENTTVSTLQQELPTRLAQRQP